jgi:hypothetical protein
MSSLAVEKTTTDKAFSSDQILRSINIVFDADYPERISHFFPTTKTINLLKQLLGDVNSSGRFVVAPYGSGKSLVASFYQQIIENRPDSIHTLRPVIDRVRSVDESLYSDIRDRTDADNMIRLTGVVVPLSGYVSSLPEALHEGLLKSARRLGDEDLESLLSEHEPTSMDEVIVLLTKIRETYGGSRFDHLDILWDEFGRHLEEIVVRGEAHRLNELQLLSEFAVRSRRLTMQLVLFLHQSLMRYASNVPQSVIHEWKKIEGRFDTHQYVDDSKEVISLASRVLSTRFPESVPPVGYIDSMVPKLQDVGLFGDFSSEEVADIISSSWPVLPTALYVLPRISARVAQNERTLFSFLFDLDGTSVVTPSGVFDYFSDLMRSDASFGGTYHHWLETQSALASAESDTEEHVIKCLSLLALGLSGERNRVSRRLLRVASETIEDEAVIRIAVDGLIDRKLLLHRKNADTVLLWHATDIDLRGRLQAEKTRLFNSFYLLDYLNEFLPPEDWRPVEYNSARRMFRYFSGRYISASDVFQPSWLQGDWDAFGTSADGVVLYVIPDSEDEIDKLLELLSSARTDGRIVCLLPQGTEGLFETALEAASIQRLLRDTSLAAEDPLVVPELQQMLDDTQSYLTRVLDKMFSPSPEGPYVAAGGAIHQITSRRQFRRFLSDQMEAVFSETPVLNNELINKMAPSRVVANARKKLTLGILERYGTADLGLEGNRPDRSMFATLLCRTGLYFEDADGRWRFARPDELADPHLRKVWGIVESFFSHPAEKPRSFSELFEQLQQPPIGLRAGVLPILLAAGFRAFPSAISVSDPNGTYIPDIMPSIIEQIAEDPEHHTIAAVPLDNETQAYLQHLERVFSEGQDVAMVETDPLRRCFDALEAWKARLPRASMLSRKFSKPVQLFQRLISNSQNPSTLFLDSLFTSYGLEKKDWRKFVSHLADWKRELEAVVVHYYDSAARSILAALQLQSSDSVREAGSEWVGILPVGIESLLGDGVSKAVVQRFRMPYDNDEILIDSLSSLLIGRRIDKWDDSTVALFDREFRNAVRRIEDEALGASRTAVEESEIAKGLIVARMRSLYGRLQEIADPQEVNEIINTIIREE